MDSGRRQRAFSGTKSRPLVKTGKSIRDRRAQCRSGAPPAAAESGSVAGGASAARTGPQRCRRSTPAARRARIPAREGCDVGGWSAQVFARVANQPIRDRDQRHLVCPERSDLAQAGDASARCPVTDTKMGLSKSVEPPHGSSCRIVPGDGRKAKPLPCIGAYWSRGYAHTLLTKPGEAAARVRRSPCYPFNLSRRTLPGLKVATARAGTATRVRGFLARGAAR